MESDTRSSPGSASRAASGGRRCIIPGPAATWRVRRAELGRRGGRRGRAARPSWRDRPGRRETESTEALMPTNVRPPYDAELAAALALVNDQLPATITADMIEAMRATPVTAPIEDVLQGRNITHREVTIPGYQGFGITVSIFARGGHQSGPGIYHTHGGGMIIGDRF